MPWLLIGPDSEFRSSGDSMILMNQWRVQQDLDIFDSLEGIEVASFQVDATSETAGLIAQARALESLILPTLCRALNRYHGLERTERFWKILLGNWLRRVVELYCFREFHILRCVKKYSIDNVKILENRELVRRTNLTVDLLKLQENIEWSDQLTSRIIKESRLPDLRVHEIKRNNQGEGYALENNQRVTMELKLSNLTKSFFKKSIKLFQKNKDAVIISTYLTRKREILLNFSFKQIPQFHDFRHLQEYVSKGSHKDTDILKSLFKYEEIECSNVLLDLIMDLFPSCYLEDMKRLQASVDQQSFPNQPRFIFTCNEFDTNEIFKLWTANQVELGTPFFIGQHGNDYGTNRFESPLVEEEISDYFLTWGWMRTDTNTLPCFNFKQPKKNLAQISNKSLILFQKPLRNDNLTWCGINSHQKYIENQFNFYSSLNSRIRGSTTIRLYQSHQNGKDVMRWQEFDPLIKFDFESTSFDLVKNSYLAVYSYDSTGILERLSLNLPVVAFWENDFFHVHEEYLDLYKKLKSVGIFHSTASQASSFISGHWENLDVWWFSDHVQEVVKEVSMKLCRNSESPVRDLNRTILGLIK